MKNFIFSSTPLFADASAAISLLSKVKGEVLLWSVREFGQVGDRLLLNSMCGSNLAAHALRVNGKRITHLHGNPEEAHVREGLKKCVIGRFARCRTTSFYFR